MVSVEISLNNSYKLAIYRKSQMAQSIKLGGDKYWDTTGLHGGHIFNFFGQLSGNSTLTLTVPNGFRGIIYAFRGATVMGQYMVNTSASGNIYICDVATVTNITHSESTNAITFTNTSSAASQIYYIGSGILT